MAEVYVEAEEVQVGGISEAYKVIWRSCRRKSAAVEVGWQQAGNRGWLLEADRARGRSRKHRTAVEGTRLRAGKAVGREDIDAVVVRVWPDPELRIVREVRAEVELVAIVGTGCVGAGGDCYALRGLCESSVVLQLAYEPAPGQVIIENHRITTIGKRGRASTELAETAEVTPERMDCRRPEL